MGRSSLRALAITDTVKPSAPVAAAELRRLGLRPTLLTGDNQVTTCAVVAATGIEDAIGETLPYARA